MWTGGIWKQTEWMDQYNPKIHDFIRYVFVLFSAMEEVSRDRCVLRSSRSYHSWKDIYETKTLNKTSC